MDWPLDVRRSTFDIHLSLLTFHFFPSLSPCFPLQSFTQAPVVLGFIYEFADIQKGSRRLFLLGTTRFFLFKQGYSPSPAQGQRQLRLAFHSSFALPRIPEHGRLRSRQWQHVEFNQKKSMAKQTVEAVQQKLLGEWQNIESRDIDHGTEFILPEETKINFYHSTGKVMIQGRDSDEKKKAELLLKTSPKIPSAAGVGTQQPLLLTQPEKIFIVYGHDTEAREQLELLLRRLKFEPVILANMVAEGQTIIEMLEKYSAGVKYACVLLTPDDEGYKQDCPKEKKPCARQNVVLELGMFLSTLGRKRVAILHKGDVELPSDIHGLVYIPFKKHVGEVKPRLAAELQEAGFQINIKDMLAS